MEELYENLKEHLRDTDDIIDLEFNVKDLIQDFLTTQLNQQKSNIRDFLIQEDYDTLAEII